MRLHGFIRHLPLLLLGIASGPVQASDGGTPDAGPPQPVTLATLAPSSQGITDLICDWLGMACGGALAVVRGDPSVRDAHAPQAAIALYDRALKAERLVVADCGNCRTPVVLGPGRVAFANGSGVFVASLPPTGTATPVLQASVKNIQALLGSRPGSPNQLLVVMDARVDDAGASPRAAFEIRVLDLNDGTVSIPPGLDQAIPLEALPALRPGQLRDGLALIVENGGLTARKAPFEEGPRVLPPHLRTDGAQRMDPVWLDDKRLLYVKVR